MYTHMLVIMFSIIITTSITTNITTSITTSITTTTTNNNKHIIAHAVITRNQSAIVIASHLTPSPPIKSFPT